MAVAAGGALLAGCHASKQQAAVPVPNPECERWLGEQRPFLANLPASVVYRHEVSLEYDFAHSPDGLPARPVVEYTLKAGNGQGMLCLEFHLDADGAGHPTRVRSESATFYKLPAAAKAHFLGGDLNRYYGVAVPPARMAEVVGRAAKGDAFEDLRRDAGTNTFLDHKVGGDDWAKLGKQ